MADAVKTKWTKEQVENLLKTEKLAYQKIELPYGLSTGGEDRSDTSNLIFNGNLDGKSVLDIGCYLGYFCHEAVRRGAKKVVGVDANENRLRQARLLADCMGRSIEYKSLNIEEEEITGQFDVVILLNVLHHLRNPIGVLDKIIPHVNERLILELAGPSSPKADKLLKKMWASWWLRYRINKLPLIIVGRDMTVNRKGEQKFFFSPVAIKHILMEQRSSFARLDILSSGFKNRYVAVAWKRQVENLIIISGATSSGKSTLIDRLMGGEIPEIAAEIGMRPNQEWRHLAPDPLKETKDVRLENVLYHYDILRPWNNDARIYQCEQGMEVLDCARGRTVVPLWTDPKLMCERLEPEVRTARHKSRQRRLADILAMYRSGKELAQRYEYWADYCRGKNAKLLFIDCSDKPKMLTENQWRGKLEKLKHTEV